MIGLPDVVNELGSKFHYMIEEKISDKAGLTWVEGPKESTELHHL